ncbi:hypothetical protein Freya10_4 [Polaribacter phage Freya_10]|nr:hypothetical protein Freya8_1 [Polaribacter phage Freya_8]QQV91220.1 hypothetical protein Freya9_4 [Polaribacter phage Freya_9]QQV91297.1 hypothetical protein Freya10_4 [Polaribacter phage Freya_10]
MSTLNSQLEIVKLKNVKFYNSKNQYVVFSGYSLFVKGLGLLRFKESTNNQENEFKTPYYPAGGLSALKNILKGGGFLDYSVLEFTNFKNI